jgi:NAD(P)H-hydrate epimerase
MLLGPGWGLEDTTGNFLQRLLSGKSGRVSRGAIGFVGSNQASEAKQCSLPALIIDADGLKLLTRIPEWHHLIDQPAILTPHPGEMSVMTGLPIAEIQKNREEIAVKYAKEWNQVVVLKGALTVVADPNGKTCVIPIATSALAKAGTGDVLAGMITGLRAQGVDPYQAAVGGAYIHAQAGLLAANQIGDEASLLASEVIEAIPQVLSSLR